MEINVLSTETIKPSSPTPPHLKTFKTSIIDKILLYGYIQFISFYTPDQNYTKQTSIQLLKESLSQCLTILYPFAGRVKDNVTIDCNDNGVLFITTHVNSRLSDLLSPQPKFETFHQLGPTVPPFCPEYNDRPAQIGIQVNEFDCGGIAIYFCLSHFIIDAVTVGMFLKVWSSLATKRCSEVSLIPAVSMFPQGSEEPMPEWLSPHIEMSLVREGRGTTKRFVFHSSAIMVLKEKVKSEHVSNPSRVEAVSSFMWKHMMEASERVWGCKQPSLLIQAADLRRRMPQLVSSGLSVGNIFWKSIAHYHNTSRDKDKGAEVDVKQLLVLVRQAIEKTKQEFVPKLLNNGGYETIRDSLIEVKDTCLNKNLNPYTISSWCKNGVNDIEFGWGKPIWVSQIPGIDVPYKNVAILMDGESESIEAWITLDQGELGILENDQGFLAFAALNPPVSL